MSIKAILSPAIKFKNFVLLNLNENLLDHDGARAVVEFLAGNKTLKVLKVKNCGLGSKSCEMLADASDKNKKIALTHIDMSDNSIDSEGFSFLATFIKNLKNDLQHFDISNN